MSSTLIPRTEISLRNSLRLICSPLSGYINFFCNFED